jgi:predicted ester cyclase
MKFLNTPVAFLFVALFFISCNSKNGPENADTAASQNSMEEKIRETNANRFKAWNTGDSELMVANLNEDFKRYSNGQLDVDGKSGYPRIMDFYLIAFPDLNLTYEILAIDGNKSFTQWTASGTNKGFFNGQPATNNQIITNGFTVVTYDDEGKALLEEAYLDNFRIFSDLGYSIKPPQSDDE